MFQSVFEGFESFLFVPNTTSRSGVHIHDSIDSKRTMIVVIIALLPAMLFGMYNVGYQHYLSIGELASTSFWSIFFFGFLAVLPKIVVAYVVGLGIEFTAAQIRHSHDRTGRYTLVDDRRRDCLCRNLRKRGIRRYGNEYFQYSVGNKGIPLLRLSIKNVR